MFPFLINTWNKALLLFVLVETNFWEVQSQKRNIYSDLSAASVAFWKKAGQVTLSWHSGRALPVIGLGISHQTPLEDRTGHFPAVKLNSISWALVPHLTPFNNVPKRHSLLGSLAMNSTYFVMEEKLERRNKDSPQAEDKTSLPRGIPNAWTRRTGLDKLSQLCSKLRLICFVSQNPSRVLKNIASTI